MVWTEMWMRTCKEYIPIDDGVEVVSGMRISAFPTIVDRKACREEKKGDGDRNANQALNSITRSSSPFPVPTFQIPRFQ